MRDAELVIVIDTPEQRPRRLTEFTLLRFAWSWRMKAAKEAD